MTFQLSCNYMFHTSACEHDSAHTRMLSGPLTCCLLSRDRVGSPALKEAEELLQRASSGGSEVPNGSTPPNPGTDVGPKTEAARPAKLPNKDTGIAFRRSLNKTGRYQRTPVHDADSLALMEEHGVGYRYVLSAKHGARAARLLFV